MARLLFWRIVFLFFATGFFATGFFETGYNCENSGCFYRVAGSWRLVICSIVLFGNEKVDKLSGGAPGATVVAGGPLPSAPFEVFGIDAEPGLMG
jgi:hypothetical protein